MVKINITIEDLEITMEQLMSLVSDEAEVSVGAPVEKSRPSCPDCGKTFKSQSSVNSHLKHCRKPAPKLKKAAVKVKPKRICKTCGATSTPSWRKAKSEDGPVCNKCYQTEVRKKRKAAEKAKKPSLPSYPGLNDKEVLEAVVSVLLSRNKEITSAHLIAGQIIKVSQGKFVEDDNIANMRKTILGRVSKAIKQVGEALGMTQCMVVDIELDGQTGAQIAMFPAKEYTIKSLVRLASK
jgi:hypothetical protein